MVGSGLFISVLEKLNLPCLNCLITLVLLIRKGLGLFLRIIKNNLLIKMFGISSTSKVDWNSYIVSTAKTPSKEIGVLVHSKKSFLSKVALYLYKSTIQPFTNVGPRLAVFLEPSGHCRNVLSVPWGINPLLKNITLLFCYPPPCSPFPLDLETVQPVQPSSPHIFIGNSPLYIGFLWTFPLNIEFFSEPP